MKRQALDLLCTKCGRHEAVCLHFWRTYHKETGLSSNVDPALLCYECFMEMQGQDTLYERQPIFITFNKLANMKKESIGFLLSRKGKESNQLAVEFWQNKVWRIWAHVSGKTKRIRKEVPAYAFAGDLP